MWLELWHLRADWGLDNLSRLFIPSEPQRTSLHFSKITEQDTVRAPTYVSWLPVQGSIHNSILPLYLTNLFKISPRNYLIYGMTLEQCLAFDRFPVNIQWVGGWMHGWMDEWMSNFISKNLCIFTVALKLQVHGFVSLCPDFLHMAEIINPIRLCFPTKPRAVEADIIHLT